MPIATLFYMGGALSSLLSTPQKSGKVLFNFLREKGIFSSVAFWETSCLRLFFIFLFVLLINLGPLDLLQNIYFAFLFFPLLVTKLCFFWPSFLLFGYGRPLRAYNGSFLEIFLFRSLVVKLKFFIMKLRITRKIMKFFQKVGVLGYPTDDRQKIKHVTFSGSAVCPRKFRRSSHDDHLPQRWKLNF